MAKKSKTSDDSNPVIQITDVAKNYEIDALKTENRNISLKCVQLIEFNQKLQDEIAHLKDLLSGAVPVIGEVTRIEVSDEEIIARGQLRRLMAIAEDRQFTLEETKQFDLFVKNKRLAENKATGVIDTPKLPNDRKQLLQIASSRTNDDGTN